MKFAKAVCGAFVSTAFGDTDDVALLQAHNVRLKVQTMPTQLPGPHCIAAGDPHIKTFDLTGETESCLSPMGDYVLMENTNFFVHARYKGYKKNAGYAFIKGLVIGGNGLGGSIVIPPFNSGECISYKGKEKCLDKQFGMNRFDVGDSKLVIRKAKGPDIVNFNNPSSLQDESYRLTYFIELRKDNNLEFLVVVNQGKQQHVLISGTSTALDGTTGQCGDNDGNPDNDHFNVDKCPYGLPCDQTNGFSVAHDECGTDREPPECLKDQAVHFRKICEDYFQSAAYATTHFVNPGDNAKEWQVFNCVTDCCGERESCPDLDNRGKWADCLVQGDPHLKTWDSPVVNKNAYGPLNDYYLMDNQYLTVQARYGSSRADHKAVLMGVALSGQMTGGDTIFFPGGHENPPIITSGGSEEQMGIGQKRFHKPLYTIRYEPNGTNLAFIFDQTNGDGRNKPLYTVVLTDMDGEKLGRVRVNKPSFANSAPALAAHIRILPQYLADVSGQCGDFDGDAGNDQSMEADIVPLTSSLFPYPNTDLDKGPFTRQCSAAQKQKAGSCCKELHGKRAPKQTLAACVSDNCCGADRPCNPREQCKVDP